MPNIPIRPRSGMTTTERIPRAWQASESTRASVDVSLQIWIDAVRRHSPEIPESELSGAPRLGAMSPLRAQHTKQGDIAGRIFFWRLARFGRRRRNAQAEYTNT